MLSQITIAIAVLTVIVNLLTEVAKTFVKFKDASMINLFVTVLSVVVTTGTFIAYSQVHGLALTWYYAFSFVVAGFMVAFAAMFGYDKLIAAFKGVKK